MATNTQISESLVRRKRSSRRPWLIIAGAIGLVTLPVLPLKFLGIPGPDFSNVTDLGKAVFKKITGTIPHSQDKGDKAAKTHGNHVGLASTDVELLDKTAQTLLRRVSDDPNDPSLHNRLGLTFLELGENHSAVTHFEEAVKVSKAKISKFAFSLSLINPNVFGSFTRPYTAGPKPNLARKAMERLKAF